MYQQSLVRAYMFFMRITAWAQLKRQANDPAHTQFAVLRKILQTNRATLFGKEHGFCNIEDAASYASSVPIHDYEALRSAIDRQMESGEPVLTADPVCHYLLTSGTTGSPKRIPLTKKMLRYLRDCQRLAAYNHFCQAPALFSGKLLSIAGAGVEGTLPNGIPYGSLSGVLQAALTNFMKRRSIPSAPLGKDHRYEAIAGEAAVASDITAAVAVNPSTFIRLKELMLRDGMLPQNKVLGDLWPNLQAVITWTHGNCANYIPSLRREFPRVKILEAGYLASELYGTIPVGEGRCVPALGHYFFEFIEVEAWDNGVRETQLLHTLEQGKRYYVIVTNESGLYRYFMHDIVEADGMFGHTPCLRFIQKGKGVTSLTGEKLYESQLLLAVKEVWGNKLDGAFFLMLAYPDPARYRLYIESDEASALAEQMDAALAALNIEYKAKRESGRLLPLQLFSLKSGAGEAYRQYCIEQGQREAQWKLVHLAYADSCHFNFTPFLRKAS